MKLIGYVDYSVNPANKDRTWSFWLYHHPPFYWTFGYSPVRRKLMIIQGQRHPPTKGHDLIQAFWGFWPRPWVDTQWIFETPQGNTIMRQRLTDYPEAILAEYLVL